MNPDTFQNFLKISDYTVIINVFMTTCIHIIILFMETTNDKLGEDILQACKSVKHVWNNHLIKCYDLAFL